MENYIKINDKTIDLEPHSDKDLAEITNACISIMALVMDLGTLGFADDKVRVEQIMKISGTIGAEIAKLTFVRIAKQKAMNESQESGVRKDA